MIPFNKPVFGINEIKSFVNGFFNDNVSLAFEKDFSQYIKRKFALFTSSGRSALYLTYKSLKLDGEIIVAPLTCSIAIMPLICAGLKPHFVDIDPETYNRASGTANQIVLICRYSCNFFAFALKICLLPCQPNPSSFYGKQ